MFRRSLLLVALLFSLSGCVPVAWVIPPMQAELGLGAAASLPPDEGASLSSPVAVGVYPLGAFEYLHERNFDVGAGYRGLFYWADGAMLHAPYLEAVYLHNFQRSFRTGRWRAGAGMRGHLFWGHPSTRVMPVAGLRGTMEFVRYVQFESVDCSIDLGGAFCGYSVGTGERGVGFFLEAHQSLTQSAHYIALYGGVFWRIPTSAGAGLVASFR